MKTELQDTTEYEILMQSGGFWTEKEYVLNFKGIDLKIEKLSWGEQEKFCTTFRENLFSKFWCEQHQIPYTGFSDEDLLRAKEITYKQMYKK